MLCFDVRLTLDAFTVQACADLPMPGITALFGPSGAGKSSLLRTIAGLERASGHLSYGGSSWLGPNIDLPPHARPVGYVFQDARLFMHRNVAGNLAYAERRGLAGAPAMREVVAALDLEPLLKRDVRNLSGGEARRVALARTLLTGAELLLLDEPLTGLDAARKHEVMGYIAELPERFSVRMLVVTHSVEEVVRLAADMVVMEEGRILHHGESAALLERLDVQALSGGFDAGVMLTATLDTVIPDRFASIVRIGEQRITVPQASAAAVGDVLRLHVRARDVALALHPVEGLSIRNQLQGHLLRLDPVAGTGYVEALVDVEGQHLRARITMLAVEDLALELGQPVCALVKSASLAAQDAV